VGNPPPPNDDFFGDLRLTVVAIQELIADSMAAGTTLRALGGGWSLSTVAVTDGNMIDTLALNWTFPLNAASLVPNYVGDPNLLQYLQCGVTIDRANSLLFERGLALKTSGASNGQTIAGAMSTCTHGSRFRFGSIPDYVRGLHIIPAPDRAIWLERASDPVFSDATVATLGAELVRDDNLFNSAVVSFGSFGVIFGVLIEAEPRYLLEVWRRRLPINDALLAAMGTLDLSGICTPYPNEEPLHFEVVVNSHDIAGGAYVTTMYQRPYRAGYTPPDITPEGRGPGDDLLGVMGKIGEIVGAIVAPAVNLVVSSEYPLYYNDPNETPAQAAQHKPVQWGLPGEIFETNQTFQKEMSAEIGVALEDTARAYQVMVNAQEMQSYPGLLAFRWVKGSNAVLAWTRFPTTCTIELPAAYSDKTTAYYEAVWNGLTAAAIPYTLHWGQMNNFTPERIQAMYGAARNTWVANRQKLLPSAALQRVFSSAFLQSCGLG
jgi:FAD/FMN-containing dehydrogenase